MILLVIKDSLVFYLLIKIACTFEVPKHYLIAFYKVHSNVYSIEGTSNAYAVYVAGKMAYLTIAAPNETNREKILNWRAINTDPTCLMFVSENKPFMLINSTVIRPMNYSNSLSGTIIELGNNEALHIPKIINPDLKRPQYEWSYLELLYFSSETEKVELISSIPWFDYTDWTYILEYRLLDHIHFNNKLYLLMFRQVQIRASPQSFSEIFIIRLCLDKGSQFLSSAVEVAYNYASKPISAAFHFDFRNTNESKRYSIALINNQSSSITFHHIQNFVDLFDDVAYNCSTGLPGISNLLHHHLRMIKDKCIEDDYKECNTGPNNTFPSGQISDKITVSTFTGPESNLIKIFTHHSGYPQISLEFETLSEERGYICIFPNSSTYCIESYFYGLTNYYPQFHVDVIHGKILIVHRDNAVTYALLPCEVYEDCLHCTIFASKYCQWVKNDNKCASKPSQTVSPETYVNFCNHIVQIKPSKIVADSPIQLQIRFFDAINIVHSKELVNISAGPGTYCTNVEINGTLIYCDFHFRYYGDFFITVTFSYATYADSIPVSVAPFRKITINPKPKSYTNIIFAVAIIISIVIILLSIYHTVSATINVGLVNRNLSRVPSNLDRLKSISKSRIRVNRFSNFANIERTKRALNSYVR